MADDNVVGSAAVKITATIDEESFEASANEAIEKFIANAKTKIEAELHLNVGEVRSGAAPGAGTTGKGSATGQINEANIGAVTGIDEAVAKATNGQGLQLKVNTGSIIEQIQAALNAHPFTIQLRVNQASLEQLQLGSAAPDIGGARGGTQAPPHEFSQALEKNPELARVINGAYDHIAKTIESAGQRFGTQATGSTGNEFQKMQEMVQAFGTNMGQWIREQTVQTQVGPAQAIAGGSAMDFMRKMGVPEEMVGAAGNAVNMLRHMAAGGGGAAPLSAVVTQHAATFQQAVGQAAVAAAPAVAAASPPAVREILTGTAASGTKTTAEDRAEKAAQRERAAGTITGVNFLDANDIFRRFQQVAAPGGSGLGGRRDPDPEATARARAQLGVAGGFRESERGLVSQTALTGNIGGESIDLRPLVNFVSRAGKLVQEVREGGRILELNPQGETPGELLGSDAAIRQLRGRKTFALPNAPGVQGEVRALTGVEAVQGLAERQFPNLDPAEIAAFIATPEVQNAIKGSIPSRRSTGSSRIGNMGANVGGEFQAGFRLEDVEADIAKTTARIAQHWDKIEAREERGLPTDKLFRGLASLETTKERLELGAEQLRETAGRTRSMTPAEARASALSSAAAGVVSKEIVGTGQFSEAYQGLEKQAGTAGSELPGLAGAAQRRVIGGLLGNEQVGSADMQDALEKLFRPAMDAFTSPDFQYQQKINVNKPPSTREELVSALEDAQQRQVPTELHEARLREFDANIAAGKPSGVQPLRPESPSEAFRRVFEEVAAPLRAALPEKGPVRKQADELIDAMYQGMSQTIRSRNEMAQQDVDRSQTANQGRGRVIDRDPTRGSVSSAITADRFTTSRERARIAIENAIRQGSFGRTALDDELQDAESAAYRQTDVTTPGRPTSLRERLGEANMALEGATPRNRRQRSQAVDTLKAEIDAIEAPVKAMRTRVSQIRAAAVEMIQSTVGNLAQAGTPITQQSVRGAITGTGDVETEAQALLRQRIPGFETVQLGGRGGGGGPRARLLVAPTTRGAPEPTTGAEDAARMAAGGAILPGAPETAPWAGALAGATARAGGAGVTGGAASVEGLAPGGVVRVFVVNSSIPVTFAGGGVAAAAGGGGRGTVSAGAAAAGGGEPEEEAAAAVAAATNRGGRVGILRQPRISEYQGGPFGNQGGRIQYVKDIAGEPEIDIQRNFRVVTSPQQRAEEARLREPAIAIQPNLRVVNTPQQRAEEARLRAAAAAPGLPPPPFAQPPGPPTAAPTGPNLAGSVSARRARLGLGPITTDLTGPAANEIDEQRAQLGAEAEGAQRRILRRGFTASVTDIFQAPFFQNQNQAVDRFQRESGQLIRFRENEAKAIQQYTERAREAAGVQQELNLATDPGEKASLTRDLAEAERLRFDALQQGIHTTKEVAEQEKIVTEARGGLPGRGRAVANLAIGGGAAAGAFALGSIVFQAAGQILGAVESGLAQVIGPEVEKATGFRGVEAEVSREAGAALRGTPDLTAALAQSTLASGLTAQTLQALTPALGQLARSEAGNVAISEQIRIQRAGRAAATGEAVTAAGGGGLFQPLGGIPGITRNTGGFLGSPIGGTASLFEQIGGAAGIGPLNAPLAGGLSALDKSLPGGFINAGLGAVGLAPLGASIQAGLGLSGGGIPVSPRGVLQAAGEAARLPQGSPEQSLAFAGVQQAANRLADFNGAMLTVTDSLSKANSEFEVMRAGQEGYTKDLQDASDAALRAGGVDEELIRTFQENKIAFTRGGAPIEGREDVKQLGADVLRGAPLMDPQQFIDANRVRIQAQMQLEDQRRDLTVNQFIPQRQAINETLSPMGDITAPLKALGVSNLGSLPGMLSSLRQETRAGISDATAFVTGTLGSTAGADFASSLDKASQFGERISRIQIGVQTQQAALSAAQYSYQIFQVNRSLQDAKGLTGQIGDANKNNLGVLERQQFMLQRQSQELSMQMTQRQINFQVAMAGFVAPGATSEERAARIKEAEKEAAYAQKQLDIQKELFGLQGRTFRVTASRQVTDLTRQLSLLERGREVELNTAKAEAKIRVLTHLAERHAKRVETYYEAAVQRTADLMDLEKDLVEATGQGLARVTRLAINAFAVTYSGIINALQGSPEELPARKHSGGNLQARGVLMTTSGAYNMTVGEAGDETVAVLRNPRPATGMTPFGGGGGGGIHVGGITVIVPASTSRGDAERLARVITRMVEENLSRRLSLLGGHRTLA